MAPQVVPHSFYMMLLHVWTLAAAFQVLFVGYGSVQGDTWLLWVMVPLKTRVSC